MGKRKTLNEFIENANNVHNGKYDYCNVKYKDVFTKVKIICPIHGEFEQIPKSHLKGHGCRCCKTSKGEKIISEFLKCNNIKYCNSCVGCINCKECEICYNCNDCINCKTCNDCKSCDDCNYCTDCNNCTNCTDCNDCNNCKDCNDCNNCNNCTDCNYCNDYFNN